MPGICGTLFSWCGQGELYRTFAVKVPIEHAWAVTEHAWAVTELTYCQNTDMSRHMNERTTVRLPKELLMRAKRKATAEGRTLTSLIEDGLRLVVNESRKLGKMKRVMPPVSKATGGPMPGIDLTDFSGLQEMDDLEYVERMKRFK
jgi:hypothetical protein